MSYIRKAHAIRLYTARESAIGKSQTKSAILKKQRQTAIDEKKIYTITTRKGMNRLTPSARWYILIHVSASKHTTARHFKT